MAPGRSGNGDGKGQVYGQVTIKATSPAADEFTTTMTIIDARTGTRVQRTGQANVYTGFQWRGRSSQAGNEDSGLREVMFVDRDWRSIEGRWFTGAYDELGMDITLERVGAESRVLGTSKTAIRAGASGQELSIYGVNLPSTLAASDIDLGPGVTVSRVVKSGADEVGVSLDVAAGAAPGARDLFVSGASRPKALAVYRNVDAIKVTPGWAMARVGGQVFPKGLAQFEARAFDNGPDGKPDTPDDIDLGVVSASWALEEYTATYDDDDVKYVGSIDSKTGRFTPNVDGPTPSRKGSRNNVGDVYAVATYTPEAGDAVAAKPLRARGHLLVTVPLYMRWADERRPNESLQLREFHSSRRPGSGSGLVPSAAVFALDDCSRRSSVDWPRLTGGGGRPERRRADQVESTIENRARPCDRGRRFGPNAEDQCP
jgi:quinohemoprotein amine dehydrogenase